MGWEFAAVWADEGEGRWYWIWRRVADDTGTALEHSARFAELDECIADARRRGFDDENCPTD